MRKTRAVGLTALAAAAALVISACSGTPGQSGHTVRPLPQSSGSAAASSGAEASGGSSAALPGADNVGKVGGSGCGIPHGPYDEPAIDGRRGPGGLERSAAVVQQQHHTWQRDREHTTSLYLTNTGFTLLRRRPEPDQQRSVRHLRDRLARPADRQVHGQRGRQVLGRRADRCRRHGAVLGCPSGKFNDGEADVDDDGNLRRPPASPSTRPTRHWR